MTEKELQLIVSKFRNQYFGTLENSQATLQDITNVLSELVESVADAKIKIPSWKYHLQTLIGKIIFTSNSIVALSKGNHYSLYKRNEKVPVIDYQSMFILTRALIENYVTLCYIYHNSLTDEEKIFRYKLWELSGLISRQNFGVISNEEIKKKQGEEKIIIEQIFNEIERLPEYKFLKKEKINRLKTHGLPRLESWHKLIENSNLNNDVFGNLYSYLSSYAHSEYLCILQISQNPINSKTSHNLEQVQLSLGLTKMIVALCIEFYLVNFKSAEIIYNSFPEKIFDDVNSWKKIGKSNS